MTIKRGSKRFSMWLDDESMELIEASAKMNNRSVAKVIRKIVREYIEEHPTRLGIVEDKQIRRTESVIVGDSSPND
jgi:predicted DNA-binding protein